MGLDEDNGSGTVTDAEFSEADPKALATYQGLADRVTRLEERVKTLATREWIYQKALALVVVSSTLAAAGGSALVRAFWS